jgi:8-oxo-dGTP pyrophosphatase MutT (NUDIX family)
MATKNGAMPRRFSSPRSVARARCAPASLLPWIAAAAAVCALLVAVWARGARATANARHPTLDLDHQRLRDLLLALDDLGKAFKHVSDEVAFSRHARLYSRRVIAPNSTAEVDYDVLGRNWREDSFAVVSVVPYDPVSKTFTMIREYNVATKEGALTFPQGCIEPSKHASPLEAAIAELGEEARLECRREDLYELLDHPSSQDKYQREKIHYFLCTEAYQAKDSALFTRDPEEVMYIERNVSVAEIKALIRAGTMQSNVIASAYLAFDYLRAIGELPVDS